MFMMVHVAPGLVFRFVLASALVLGVGVLFLLLA